MTSDNHVTGPKPCPTCQGKGVYDSYDGDGRAFEFECYTCDGTGRQVSASEQASVHSPQSSEAVERVARAICLNRINCARVALGHDPVDDCRDSWKQHVDDARAAIAALQHPAKEMGK